MSFFIEPQQLDTRKASHKPLNFETFLPKSVIVSIYIPVHIFTPQVMNFGP